MVSIHFLALNFIFAQGFAYKFLLLDMDIDRDADPIPTANETIFPAPSTQTAPEGSTDQEVITPAAAVPPTTSGVKNAEKSSTISVAASGEVQASPTSISVDILLEDAVLDGLKGSLVKASEIELRLREMASDAGVIKARMHVSTCASFLPTGCTYFRVVLRIFSWGYYLVHLVGVAPKAPSNFLELFGVLCRDY